MQLSESTIRSDEKTARTQFDPVVDFITTIATHPRSVQMLLRRTEYVLVGLQRDETMETDYQKLELDWSQQVARLTSFDPDSLAHETTSLPLGEFRELVIEWRNLVVQRCRYPR